MAQQKFTSEGQAARELQSQITTAVGRLNFPGGLGINSAEVARGINQNIDSKVFDTHNQSGIVEVHAHFVATKSDGKPAFELEIIWDADNPPPVDKTQTKTQKETQKETQTAHFGWEIYLDKRRVAGPGHVFFEEDVILTNYRNNKRDQVEVASLRLSKNGGISTGEMQSTTKYYRLE